LALKYFQQKDLREGRLRIAASKELATSYKVKGGVNGGD
jgi:hypothetical protein